MAAERRSSRAGALSGAAALLALALVPRAAGAAAKHELSVQVIYASADASAVDPKLEKLAKQLAALKFKSYRLKDQARFALEIGSSGRMQLPGGEWMELRALDVVADEQMLRVVLAVKKLDFEATVSIAPGATVVVRGPPFEAGTLILAVTRGKTP